LGHTGAMSHPGTVAVHDLSRLELFDGVSGVDRLAGLLEAREFVAGAEVVSKGDASTSFALVGLGVLEILDTDGTVLAIAERGSIVGELGIASGRPRRATAVAASPAVLYVGGRDAFEEMLALPGLRSRLQRIAAARLATAAPDVAATLRDGSDVYLRPLLASDKLAYTNQLRHWSAESLRRRFFSPAAPSADLIDYLVEIDYVDHFAWVVVDRFRPDVGLGLARYVRSAADPRRAEVAFGVEEESRGRGVATILLGALAAAADCAGITTFTAEMLAGNDAMRAVLGKADARFHAVDGASVSAELEVGVARALLPPHLGDGLAAAANDVVSAAGIALVVPHIG
jgi:CRP-like cAMP-binding protein